jgi:hypothetical protein
VMRALAKNRDERWQSAREMQGALEEFVRQGRIGASRTALSTFMSSIFEDKLDGHVEALLQDKQLADTFAADGVEAGVAGGIESGRPWSLGPTTMRTVTDARAPGQNRAAVVLGALALLAVVGTASGAARSWRRPPREGSARPAGALATPGRDHGVIAIASVPAGAEIFVNGELAHQTTPATLTNIGLGVPFVVALAATGFEPASQTVTLTDADPSGAISLVLEPSPHPKP